MLPVLTRPRGSRKATLESFDVALKDFKASAKDSALVLPKPGTIPAESPISPTAGVVADGLKRPVHDFGVDQAFGAGGVILLSSATVSTGAAGISVVACFTSVVAAIGWASSVDF